MTYDDHFVTPSYAWIREKMQPDEGGERLEQIPGPWAAEA
jgi:hypothetical protein